MERYRVRVEPMRSDCHSRPPRPRESEEQAAHSTSDYPRRRSQRKATPQQQGWRATKRSSKLGRRNRREARADDLKQQLNEGVRATKNRVLGVAQIAGMVLVGAIAVIAVLALLALGINTGARWLAKREVERGASPEERSEKAKENLLIIGSSGSSAEFLAVRLDETDDQILGIAIPSGAFMEVPGQGFERVGDSFSAGPGVSLAAVSNFLAVPFEHYVVIDAAIYQDALANQSLRDVMGNVTDTDLSAEEREDIAQFISEVTGDRTALVPLPVKPIDLGSQTFFEPQRDKIADLLLQWWGVKLGAEDAAVRVIIYNGVGTPGIAGMAAQQLIAAGMRVVDTKNADRFDYDTTMIAVQNGDMAQGEQVKAAIGVGEVIDQPSEQDVADMIVIIGKDYVPPATSGQ
ncbi:MAG: LytR C-terminal domain-containing protein [Coriobacteriia bacterium]|nr:LytR C-terminal domain-containing protein [Coriobacteriia bacterium]